MSGTARCAACAAACTMGRAVARSSPAQNSSAMTAARRRREAAAAAQRSALARARRHFWPSESSPAGRERIVASASPERASARRPVDSPPGMRSMAVRRSRGRRRRCAWKRRMRRFFRARTMRRSAVDLPAPLGPASRMGAGAWRMMRSARAAARRAMGSVVVSNAARASVMVMPNAASVRSAREESERLDMGPPRVRAADQQSGNEPQRAAIRTLRAARRHRATGGPFRGVW